MQTLMSQSTRAKAKAVSDIPQTRLGFSYLG